MYIGNRGRAIRWIKVVLYVYIYDDDDNLKEFTLYLDVLYVDNDDYNLNRI